MAYEGRFLVSIGCMTYNHSGFIVDALNGFAMQRTRFPFVAVVVDDASTDGEQEVIRSYVNDHFVHLPDKGFKEWETDDAYWTFTRHKVNVNCHFVVAYLKNNLYKQQKKKETVIRDWMDSKYIALCEGDDYWMDPLKLQKQVDFLENHEDYSMCFTNSIVKDRNREVKAINMIWDTYSIEDIISTNALNMRQRGDNVVSCGHTSTILYRVPKEPLPTWISKCYIGDEPLFIALAQYGKAKFLNEAMTVYRAGVGVSSFHYCFEDDWKNRIKMYKIINRGLHYRYCKIINPIIASWYYNLGKRLFKTGHKAKGIFSLLNAFWFCPRIFRNIVVL